MEKRKHQRIVIEDLAADVADGVGFYQGMVVNISQSGICMTDLSQQLDGDVENMTIVVSGKGGCFKMNVRPRWYTHGGARKTIGVEVVTMPPGWAEFVVDAEPVFAQVILEDIQN